MGNTGVEAWAVVDGVKYKAAAVIPHPDKCLGFGG